MSDRAIPFEFLNLEQRQQIFNQCSSPACSESKAALEVSRREIVKECDAVAFARSRRNATAAVAAAMLTAAITAAVVAATTPWPINLILAIVAATLAVIAITSGVMAAIAQSELESAMMRLSQARQTFTDNAARVQKDCGPYCAGDTVLQACLAVGD